jgi:hypothetical protein
MSTPLQWWRPLGAGLRDRRRTAGTAQQISLIDNNDKRYSVKRRHQASRVARTGAGQARLGRVELDGTSLVSQKNTGTVISEITVSGQLRMTMATTLEANVPTLARIVDAVVVTTESTPPTSFCSRDWISPVLVE